MQTYEILVKNRAVIGNSKDMTLVRTSVGIDQVHVLFDNPEWLDFPITITFAQGDRKITQSLVVSGVDTEDWVAESTCEVPWEVIESTGPIRVTLQGTDSGGNHIITAKGAPLAVEEAGDVIEGDVPSDAPDVDDWHQAMADAMAAVNSAATLVATLQSRLDQMVEEATQSIEQYTLPIATSETLGGIKIGENLTITEDGILSAPTPTPAPSDGEQQQEVIIDGLNNAQLSLLYNLQLLAAYTFDTEFIEGILQNTVLVKPQSLPLAKISAVGAVKVDDDTIKVTTDGTISATRYVLPTATSDTLGGVIPDGETILNDNGTISIPIASPVTLGLVKPDGVTISVDEHGVLTASGGGGGGGGYILPKATTGQLGGVRVDGVTIGVSDGVISVLLKDASSEVY